MPFGAHETMEVHEILNEKINMINHFAWYMQNCQDPQLRNMIERHMQTIVSSYDELVHYTHDYSRARPQAYGMPHTSPQQINYGLDHPSSKAPNLHGQWNDTMIASAVLCAHKNSAKNHMMASLEIADPNIRQMLVNGAVSCSNQAYEVFRYMNERGIYQVPKMNDHTAKTFLHTYQPAMQQMNQTLNQQPQLY
ncbi:coat protein F [Insulibacter thermoxylanivorax]|uniref:Coat protein F n=1 Tax=Insulibacter thermoxylanivorax TaxID=2749268 RepID=A0A916QJ81_9BACL|nr:spore coat protein [Insulibacter thermoxylanivorax]GFR39522.1 coat protein F [Insulibacter thermoxylanivorax]